MSSVRPASSWRKAYAISMRTIAMLSLSLGMYACGMSDSPPLDSQNSALKDQMTKHDEQDCDEQADAMITVQKVSFPVTLSDSRTYQVAGYIYRAPKVKHRTVQLLVHGATYNHLYWDAAAVNGVDYSYARAMARRGYLVIAIDQLGAGASDKPDGDFFGLDDAARALHQVAGQVRTLGGPETKLALIGHSNGAVTAIYAQGTYRDADVLVSTGWVHGFRPLPVNPADPDIQAAVSTPYINFRGPKRNVLMYFPAQTDLQMIAYDEATLTDSMPRRQFFDLIGIHGEITGLGPGGQTTRTRSQQVTVPTLVQEGERDDLIAPPTSGPPSEQAFYPLVADFTKQVLPQIGHCYNLHLNHDEGWKSIDRWLKKHE